MLIDWFTVIAQIVNFLILVWLLKRFLYKPILNAIDAREKRIVDQLADANAKESEAQKQLDDFRHKNEMFEIQRDSLLSQATTEAHDQRQKLLEKVQKEADLLRSKRQEMLRNEQRSLNREIIRRTQQEVFAIAQRTLADLAGAKLEERMGEVFISRLRDLSSQDRTLITADLKSSSRPAIVRSTFDLPQSQRVAIERTIQEVFVSDTQIQFETSPDLVSGIELSVNGHKVAWNIADYLTSLEKSIGQLLEERPQAEEASDQHAD